MGLCTSLLCKVRSKRSDTPETWVSSESTKEDDLKDSFFLIREMSLYWLECAKESQLLTTPTFGSATPAFGVSYDNSW